ncbi:MAG: helix-turn-helix domain-containing protein [Bacteroidia bacterium]|nr:helix-turn-helix domain-containing protein [Bacteroidia bacterium]MDW8334877.1 helix-turn-helix domain-containing protein [Bacteroidia bacterium]
MDAISENLRNIRRSKGWTQEELAEKLNMSPSAYGRLERGEVEIGMEFVWRLASVLGSSVVELLATPYGKGADRLSAQPSHERDPDWLLLKLRHAEEVNELLRKYIALLEEKVRLLEKGRST